MNHFLTDLLSNLALLAVVVVACRLLGWFMPGVTLSGANIFVALMLFALLFDATLTFLVFADAQSRYGQFSTTAAFCERAAAYLASGGLVFACSLLIRGKHRQRQRQQSARAGKQDAVVIRTSPYSESHLPM